MPDRTSVLWAVIGHIDIGSRPALPGPRSYRHSTAALEQRIDADRRRATCVARSRGSFPRVCPRHSMRWRQDRKLELLARGPAVGSVALRGARVKVGGTVSPLVRSVSLRQCVENLRFAIGAGPCPSAVAAGRTALPLLSKSDEHKSVPPPPVSKGGLFFAGRDS
jgi:hypothetical protein